MIKRKPKLAVNVGSVIIGGNSPIVIQSMTNTPTSDVHATVNQIKELCDAGSEIVRITVDTEASAKAVSEIIRILSNEGYTVPIVGDFHFNGHILLEKYPEMAKSLAKYRINPGNVGIGDKHDEHFKTFIKCAIDYDKPIRIGINGGSLDKSLLEYNMQQNAKQTNPKTDKEVFIDSMVESCLLSVQKAQEFGLPKNKIILSVKMSDVQDMIEATKKLHESIDCPLHLGLTEAGGSTKGLVASAAALGILLQQGIGDTIRISITPEPGQKRSLEVEACKFLLQSMGFRNFQPIITSCPGCGRTSSTAFQTLAKQVQDEIHKKMNIWKQKYPGCENKKIAIMGCIVNGIGEASNADVGIFFPGNNENPKIPVYLRGKPYTILEGTNILQQFMDIVEKFLAKEI